MGNTTMHCKTLDNRLFYDTSLFTQFQELIARHEEIAEELNAARSCTTMPFVVKRKRPGAAPSEGGTDPPGSGSTAVATSETPTPTGDVVEEEVPMTGPSGAWCGDAVLNKLYEEAKDTQGWLHWWSNDPQSPHKDWTIFGLMQQGQLMHENCKRCPKTVALLSKIPGIRVAGFSRLQPHSEIQPHTGFTGRVYGSLAFHLGLIIPPRGAGIQVGTQKHFWRRPGEIIIFDDTYAHWAWNHSDSERIILYIDFMIPQHILASLPPPIVEEEESDSDSEEESNSETAALPTGSRTTEV